MAKRDLPTPDVLRQLLRYEPETGKLFWRVRPASSFAGSRRKPEWLARNWNSRWAGKPAFTADNGHGYKRGALMGFDILAHRLAWAIHCGEWPRAGIDHINGDRSDNRIANLRLASVRQNARNAKCYSTNQSGVPGVSFHKQIGKWRARVHGPDGEIHLGCFARKEDAISARREAALSLGYDPSHGR